MVRVPTLSPTHHPPPQLGLRAHDPVPDLSVDPATGLLSVLNPSDTDPGSHGSPKKNCRSRDFGFKLTHTSFQRSIWGVGAPSNSPSPLRPNFRRARFAGHGYPLRFMSAILIIFPQLVTTIFCEKNIRKERHPVPGPRISGSCHPHTVTLLSWLLAGSFEPGGPRPFLATESRPSPPLL